MLTQYHYRFLKLAEEATEIAHRVAKLMQFGPGEREPGQIYTNAERVRLEMMDLMTCYSELVHRGNLAEITDYQFEEHETVKLAKMEKFLKLSIDLGEAEPDERIKRRPRRPRRGTTRSRHRSPGRPRLASRRLGRCKSRRGGAARHRRLHRWWPCRRADCQHQAG